MRTAAETDGLTSIDWQRLDLMESSLETANAAVGKATWNICAREGRADLNRAQARLAAIFADAASRRFIENSLAHCNPEQNPVLHRRLTVWRNCFIGPAVDNVPEISQLKTRLQERIAG